jgi:hypothetical protein
MWCLCAQAADNLTALVGHLRITADAGLGRDRGGFGTCHGSRLVVNHNHRSPAQYVYLSPFFPHVVHGAAETISSTDRCCCLSPFSRCPPPRPVVDGPALRIHAKFAVFFLQILLFFRTAYFARVKHTMLSAADAFRCQSAFERLNTRQHRLRRMAVSALFAFVIMAAPMCAKGQVFGTYTAIPVLSF